MLLELKSQHDDRIAENLAKTSSFFIFCHMRRCFSTNVLRALRYRPALGFLASAHLLAAAGDDDFLEVDANPNPLRGETFSSTVSVENGPITLSDESGLGTIFDSKNVLDPCECGCINAAL